MAAAPEADEQVLSTLNRDGSRRWLRPRLSRGTLYRRRLVFAWGLILVFTAIPYLRMNGKPMVLLDIPRRQFTLFGTTFLPTDTLFLMLLLVGIAVAIFLATALYGRVWCGWGCPQTVYMEFVYRPLERLFDNRSPWSRRLGVGKLPGGLRQTIRFVLYLAVSMFLAHTFLAYFVGVEQLFRWVRSSPFDHPVAFVIMAGTTLAMLLDFGYFREQVCLVACPYGRFQSVLLDRRSMIVAYDPNRGEPRRTVKERRATGEDGGDCIHCGACVVTCPTGIDIRDGLQMECINCTQCIDACDAIMDKVGKPRGLIRYSSQAELHDEGKQVLRPRVVIYPAILAIAVGLLVVLLANRAPADVTVLRGIGTPYAELPDGQISNQLRVKIVNRSEGSRTYRIEFPGGDRLQVIAPNGVLALDPGETETATLFVNAPRDVFVDGGLPVTLRVVDGEGFVKDVPYRLLGPFGSTTGASVPGEGAP
jgi:cytochrome c oxidase accessory protein FixG